jgi:hypothetical protein
MANGVFRKKKVYFSQVSNVALRDNKLSLKAKGLYALIQSYITIEDFILYKNTLKKNCREGSAAFEGAWNELKASGYLLQYKSKTPEGYFTYEYELIDDNPKAIQNKVIHTPKTEGMDNLPYGQVGVYNKTHSNKTKSNNTISLHQTQFDGLYIGDDLHHSAPQPDVVPISPKVTKRKDDGYYDLKAVKDKYFEPELLPYIDCYLNAQASYRRADGHSLYIKRISKDNLTRVYSEVSDLVDDGIDIEDWKEAVQEHFDTLAKGNDGDILAFLEASRRYFG